MKLIGKVKVQLFDAKTGKEVYKYEDHNILTNAAHHLANGCPYGLDRRTWGALDTETAQTDWSDIHSSVLGGVLIFENTIAESASHLFEPLDNYPCGYASMAGQDVSDSRSGTYNGIESGDVTGGFEWVYDFTTSAAIGDWDSICLTSAQAGYGYIKGQQSGSILDSVFRRNMTSNVIFRGATANYIYFVSATYGAVAVSRLPLKPFDIPLYGNNINGTPTSILTPASGARIHIDDVANKIHVLTIAGQTLTITTYNDEEDLTDTTTTTLELDVGVTIPYTTMNRDVTGFCVADGYAYLSGSSKVLKVNMSNAAVVDEITITTHTHAFANVALSRLTTGDIYCYPDIIDSTGAVHTIGAGSAADASTDSIKQINNWVIRGGTTGDGYAGSILTPYLGTIFHLPSPVQKLSTMTAKIKYKLTVEEES